MSEPSLAEVADKTVDRLASGVKAIADAAQKVAPRAWEVAVRQQRVEATVELSFSLLSALVIAAAAVFTARNYRRWVRLFQADMHAKDRRRYPTITPVEPTGDEDAFPVHLVCGLVAVATLTLFPTALKCAADALIVLSNPEYYAAKELIGAIR